MKAVVITDFGGPEVLKVIEMDQPSIGATEVLVKVVATSVNFADVKARRGQYHGTGQPPFSPGLDAAGIVEAVGAEVQRIKVGDRVIAFPKTGSYAEYVAADEALTFVIPDNLDFDIAAACPTVAFTSYKLLADVANLQAGETVLIHAAAGGIGTTAIQLAKLLGAGTVIGTVGNMTKMSAAIDAGADHVICYESEDFAEKVNELTDGNGADVILDSISGWVTEKSIDCLAYYGRLVNFGIANGDTPGIVKSTDLHSSCRSVLGFSLGTTRKRRPHLLQDTAEKVLPYLADGRLQMKIGARYSLEEAAKAHELVESRQSIGKVLIDVNL